MQSDWESASEAEDSGISSIGAQLEHISKEQIYQAYRKSMDRYQKYRGRYTELARKYRELEKDNAKARQVLVETQDKALRRISELREQCSLEQQAKAHLESALRLEMEELQFVVKTLKTKLEVLGENPESVLNGSASKDESLINLSSENDKSNDYDEQISKLEQELKSMREQFAQESKKCELSSNEIRELTLQLDESNKQIKDLKVREEESMVTMAENKLMIHSELENKETEVKNLRVKLTAMENNESSTSSDLKALKEKLEIQLKEHDQVTRDKLKLEDRLKDVFEEKKSVNNELKDMKDKIEKVNNKFKELSEDKISLQSQNEQLNSEIKNCKNEMNDLQQQKSKLSDEIKNIKIVNENSESEAIQSLQESMKETISQLEVKISDTTRDLNKLIEEKGDENKELTAKSLEIEEKLQELESERNNLIEERDSSRKKIEALKTEKRDFEKTLEREIREKNELKTQVTNILQEIGRLEEQLKEVRTLHSSIQTEKQKLEDKIERIQKQHNDAKSKSDKDQNHKWQNKLKECETKLQEVQCENSQLAEKNCLLEESTRRNTDEVKRIQSTLTDSQEFLRDENSRLSATIVELEERNKAVNDQLSQCTGDHAKLFNDKELQDHQYRSLEDANEAKEKEKLCLMDNVTCLEQELSSIKVKVAQLESEKQNLNECCDNLRVVVENIKQENDAMIKTRDELQKSLVNMKSEFEKMNVNKENWEGDMNNLKTENKDLGEKNKLLANELDSIKTKNQSHLTELENLLKHTNDEKQSLKESLNKNATDIEKKMENYEDIKIQNEYLNTLVKQLESDLRKSNEDSSAMTEKFSKHVESEKVNDEKIVELTKEIVGKEESLKALKELEVAVSSTNKELENANKELLLKVQRFDEEMKKFTDYEDVKGNNEKSNLRIQELETQLEKCNKETSEKLTKLESNEKTKDENVQKLNENIQELMNKIETLSEDNKKLEKEIDSSRAIIKDLNKDMDVQLKEIDTMKEEKAQLVEAVEGHNMKIDSMDKELNSIKSTSVKSSNSEKVDALTMENYKLQESNQELLMKLENLEKSSNGKISNLTQEIEELLENSKQYVNINIEFNELRKQFDELVKERNSLKDQLLSNGSADDEQLVTAKSEKDQLENQLKKIMLEVEDVSNKNLFLEQKVENYLILEQSNERMRLTNEKLTRQLDETLVSFSIELN